MKKILKLMTTLTTVTTPLLNLTTTNLNFHIQKRETTPTLNTVPSLQKMITTINIGQIETNTQEDIIQGLQQAQNLNPATNLIREFLLTQNNNNNLVFENINHTTARIHLIRGQYWNNTTFIPRIIIFTINFWTNRFILPSIITTNDIEYVEDNSSYTILRTLQEIYPLITQLNLHLSVSNITTNSARISYFPENNFSNLRNNYVDINFQTNHPTLNTMNLNTNLGELQDNSESTILSTFLNVNSSNTSLLEYITVGEITNNSAIIYSQTYIEVWREIWIPNEELLRRPATIEEEYNNLVQYYEITYNTIRVTFTLQNNNQNETQIIKPDTNSNDNNLFNHCPTNIYLNHQNIKKRNIENSNIKQYCMTTSKTLTKDTTGGNLKSGDTYFGTNNGVFLKINNRLYKFHDLNFPIIDIKLDNQDSAYIVNDKKEIYHLNLHGWDSIKMPNAESTNLAKEIKLFYNQKKENLKIEHNWWNKPWNYTIIHDFNLGNINPLDYEKIEFLGDDKDFYSKISWGNTPYYGKKLNEFNYTNFKNHLTECHVVKTADGADNCGGGQIKEFVIQNIKDSFLLAHISGYQDLSLTWYKKNNNYHLQVLVDQGVDTTGSTSGGSVWLNLGKGICLYND